MKLFLVVVESPYMKTLSRFIFIFCLVIVGAQFDVSIAFADKVTPTPVSVTMDEDADTEVITLTLDEPIIVPEEGDPWVTITISSDDSRVELSDDSIVFLDSEWMDEKELTITTVGDDITNPDNDVVITLSVVSDSEYYNGYENTISVTLIDDEADITPPETFIDSSDTNSSVATFEFSSNEVGATFECKLDGGEFAPCVSPYDTPVLADGEHSFEVRATDLFLNTDASPATEVWTYESIPPTVESVFPIDGATNVDVDPTIIITFFESIDDESFIVSTSPCEDECATYDVEWSEENTVVTLVKANGSFEYNTEYTISFTAEDEYGNAIEEEYEWSFITVRRTSTSGSYRRISTQIHFTNLTPSPEFIFTKNLKFLMNDMDVKELQKFLNTHGFPVSLTGPGSLGFETNMFGIKTRAALVLFQKANNITPAVGFFGPITRGVINGMLE